MQQGLQEDRSEDEAADGGEDTRHDETAAVTLHPKREAQTPKREARNSKPETRNPKPKTRNPKPKPRNPDP